jgi:hypothetical protein
MYPAFPPSCPFRSFRNPVSSTRHIARSMQIYCTTRSCTLHNQIYGTQNWAFSWMYSRSLRSCRLMGGFINSPLPPVPTPAPRATRPLRSADVTPFHRYYEPRRHRLAFSRLPGGCRLYGRLAPSISRWGEDGFSSCSACPCHRAIPNPPRRSVASHQPVCGAPCCLRPEPGGSASGAIFCRGHLWVH